MIILRKATPLYKTIFNFAENTETMRRPLFIAALALLSAALFPYDALALYPSVRNFTKTDYKAGTQNWCITENGSRFMYFANNSGMLEYDGKNWILTPISNFSNVRSVMYDERTGRIYAGAFNEFGWYSLSARGEMTYTSMRDRLAGERDMSEVWRIVKAGDDIYLHDDYSVYRLDADSIRTVFSSGAKINSMAAAGPKVTFSAIGSGLMQISENGEISRIRGCESIKDKRICAILPYAGSTERLIVTEFDGVYLWIGGQLRRLRPEMEMEIMRAQVFCAATDGKHLALGTISDGVFIISLDSMSCTHLNTFSGLQNNSVLSMFFDSAGNLWLGLDKGIDYVTLNSPEKSVFNTDRLYGTGYCSLFHNGRLYLGTNQGLYFTGSDPSEDTGFGRTGERIMQVNGLKGQVWCLEEICGTIFCGHDHGLFVIEGDEAKRIKGVNGIWKISENPFIPGEILGCSYNGLFRLEKINGQWTPHMIGGEHDSSSIFEPDSDGTIWLYHWMKGLFRLTLDERRDSIVRTEYFSREKGFPTDRNNMPNRYGDMMVFSSEGGFYVFDRQDGKMKPYDRFNRLFSRPPVAVKIHESPYGDILFLSGAIQTLATRENGEYRIDSMSLKFLQNRRIPGFDDITWVNPGQFIINTEDGFSWIDIQKPEGHPNPPDGKTTIKSVRVTAGKDSLIFGTRQSLPDSSALKRLRLPYRDNSLRFEFIRPQYAGNDAVEYRWILERYDRDWSGWSTQNVKEYTGLPQGNYVFRAASRDTVTSDETESAFRFTILPPWYLSKAAVACYAALLALATYLLIRLISSREEKQAEEIEKRKQEEMKAQQAKYEEEAREKEKEIVMLRNQTLEADLKLKSQDLANSTMNLIRKNEILIKIKNDLGKVQTEMEENNDKAKAMKRLMKIQADIRENIGHDDDWQKFEQNFDMVYEDYLKRLKHEFPKLTAGDMRLCAYLKLDLSSKDIASMMNMSVRSVEMARYRLRQKIGLTREDNLSDFLQNF